MTQMSLINTADVKSLFNSSQSVSAASKHDLKLQRKIEPRLPTKILIAISFGYQIVFNYLPTGFRVQLGTLIGLFWVVWTLWHFVNRRVVTTAPYLAISIMFLCCLVQQFELGSWLGDWQGFARYSTWILALPGILSMDFTKLIGVIHKCALAVIALSLFNLLTKGTILLDSLYRRGIFTGGDDGAHASGLTMAASTLIVFGVWYGKRNVINLVPFVTGLLLLYEIRVSTAQLVTLIPIAWITASTSAQKTSIYQRASTLSARARATILSFSALVAIVAYHESVSNTSKSLSDAGSGRLGTWAERLQTFSARDVVTKLIGTGPYSDIQISSVWWWSAKNAHNDLLTLLMEFGLFGVVVYVIIVRGLLTKFKGESFGLVLAFMFGSLTSNAFLSRPIITILMILAYGAVNQCIVTAKAAREESNSLASEI